jgi:hypothetical protein
MFLDITEVSLLLKLLLHMYVDACFCLPCHGKVAAELMIQQRGMGSAALVSCQLHCTVLSLLLLLLLLLLQVRLTFKPESQQLWIASNTTTQKRK